MAGRIVSLMLALCMAASALHAQYVVSSVLDAPDDDLTDNIFRPQTLRSAIENVNKLGVAATITVNPILENSTFELMSGLPTILPKVDLDGKGATLKPGAGSSATIGLAVRGDRSTIKNVRIEGFPGTGLAWQASDGTITSIVVRGCGVGLNCNSAKRNQIGEQVTSYYSNYFYGMKGTGGHGISLILGSDDNTITYCSIGVDENGAAQPNSRNGIYSESIGTVISKNLISGNEYDGVSISGRGQQAQTKISENMIGTDRAGTSAIPNLQNGIRISQSTGDVIEDNLVSGNVGNGIFVADNTSTNIVIRRNIVGLGRGQRDTVPNGAGIRLNGSLHTVYTNIVSGNRSIGISSSGSGLDLAGNIVGLDGTQRNIFGNRGTGVVIDFTSEALIGDPTLAEPNIVAGNGGDGVALLSSGQSDLMIWGFIIGTDSGRTLEAPNMGSGIRVRYDARNILITKNVIAFSGKDGIEIERNVVIFLDPSIPPRYQRPSNITVRDNAIGWTHRVDSAGAIGRHGISVLNADSIEIDRNEIVACAQDGIHIANDSTRHVRITRNNIGIIDSTLRKHRIGRHGVHVLGAVDVQLGDPDDGEQFNAIWECGGYGVRVGDTAARVMIRQNEIGDNDSGGIELDTAHRYWNAGWNDALDRDTGSNGWQNTVELYSGRVRNAEARVAGFVHGRPSTMYRIDLYLDRDRSHPAHPRSQGCVMAGWINATSGPNGLLRIDTVLLGDTLRDSGTEFPNVTLTVTGPDGTSAFSGPPLGLQPLDIAVEIDTVRSTVLPDGTAHLYATVTNVGFDVPTTVTLRDSLFDAYAVDQATISSGVATVFDDVVLSTIPALAVGASVEYHATGRAIRLGEHLRSIVALPSEVDVRLHNNRDTIRMQADAINSVDEGVPMVGTLESHDGTVTYNGPWARLVVVDMLGRCVLDAHTSSVSIPVHRGIYVATATINGQQPLRRIFSLP